jgi:hypothetical protein
VRHPTDSAQSGVCKTLSKDHMVECQPASNAAPFFSVVIAVHNDGVALDACLHSLAQQILGPSFEVIVVDDGSSDVTPESVSLFGVVHDAIVGNLHNRHILHKLFR